MKFSLLINMKSQLLFVGILIFMSRQNFLHSWVDHEKCLHCLSIVCLVWNLLRPFEIFFWENKLTVCVNCLFRKWSTWHVNPYFLKKKIKIIFVCLIQSKHLTDLRFFFSYFSKILLQRKWAWNFLWPRRIFTKNVKPYFLEIEKQRENNQKWFLLVFQLGALMVLL